MPESMSMERRALLAGYGARLVLTPAEEGMAGAVGRAAEMAEKEGAWLFDQFSSPNAVEAHYYTTRARDQSRQFRQHERALWLGLVPARPSPGPGFTSRKSSGISGSLPWSLPNRPSFRAAGRGRTKIQGIGADSCPKCSIPRSWTDPDGKRR